MPNFFQILQEAFQPIVNSSNFTNHMTLTDLAGFPMVMAVSQHAINAQMAKVYEQSTKEAERFPKVPWNLGEEDGSWTLTVDEFKAPEVDFDTDVQQGCRLKMTIKTG